MKHFHLILRTIAPALLLALLASAAYPQTREKFGISAKAGGVNAVSGSVMVSRKDMAPQLLTNQDDLVAGDTVTTGQESQAEVLLNPGSYLRLAANSEFVLVDNALDSLSVKLVKGSAIIEASGGDYADVWINVLARQESLVIIRGGIYRFNVQGDSASVMVSKGRVLPGRLSSKAIKGGTKVTYGSSGEVVAKLDKKDQDDFDFWSKKRAETLAQANRKMNGRTVQGYLAGMNPVSLASPGNRWGYWAYSPFSRCYAFLPFYFGLSSGYGYDYGSHFNRAPYPGYNNPVIYGNPNNGFPGGAGNTGSGGSSGSSGAGPGSSPTVGPSAPSTPMGSQAGPRDPDSGSRSINRIKDPNN